MDREQLNHALKRPRAIPGLQGLETRVTTFTPGDRLIAGMLALLMVVGVFIMLATLSTHFMVEIPAYGGTHTEGVVGTPRFINPVLAISDTDRDLTALTFAGLLAAHADGSLTPALAAHYEISDDGRTYTVTLRPDAVFSDGTPVTSDDVLFTIDAAQNPAVVSPVRANWEGVQVEAPDAHTVVFTLKSPYAPFIENLTLGILPKHLWKGVTPEEFPFSSLNSDPVGAGPYKVAKVVKNASGVPTEVHLDANQRAVSVPYVTHFAFRFYEDQESLTHALDAGTIEAAYSVAPVAHTTLHEAVYQRIFAVFLNQSQNQIFADQGVRKALDAALDKQALVDTILLGYGTPIDGPLPPSFVRSATTTGDHLARAQQILADDGWSIAASSSPVLTKVVKSGKTKRTETLAFTLTTGNAPELLGAAEAVAGVWRSLGADVTVKAYDQNELQLSVIRPRSYDALLFGQVVGGGGDLFAFWHSSQRNDPGLNIALYANTAVDKLLAEARAAQGPDAARAASQKAASIIGGETAAIFLYAPYFTYVTEPGLKGITLGSVSAPSDRFADVTSWHDKTEHVWPLFAKN